MKKRLIPLVLQMDGSQVPLELGKRLKQAESELASFNRRVKSSAAATTGFTPSDLKAFQSITREQLQMTKSVSDNQIREQQRVLNESRRMETTRAQSFTRTEREKVQAVQRGMREQTRAVEEGASKQLSIFARIKSGLKSAYDSMRGGSSPGGGLLPGLGNISEIITAIPQIGNLAGSLLRPLTDAAERGIKFNMMIEGAERSFEGMAGGADKAKVHVASLMAFAEDKRLKFEGVLQASRYMNIFGFKIDEQIPKLSVWLDAVAAGGDVTADKIEGVVRGFGQMLALNRVNAEEANQLSERGIPFWELLAKAIGKTVAETRALGEAGKLNARQSVEAVTAMIAIDDRYKGQLERRGKSLEGQLDALASVQARAEGVAMQGATGELSKTIEAGLQNKDLASKLASGFNAAITPAAALIRQGIEATLGGGLSAGFTSAFDTAKDVVKSKVIGFATDAILGPLFSMLGVNSPSTKTYYMGLMMAQGLQDGFRDGLKKFKPEIEKLIEEHAKRTNLDPNLIRAMMRQESGGRERATSHKGASGLMQLMPGTAKRFGVTDIYDPAQNIRGGTDYMAFLLKRFRGDVKLALAGYNAGEGAVDKYGGIPPYKETQNYVKSIMAMYERGGGPSWIQQFQNMARGTDGAAASPFTGLARGSSTPARDGGLSSRIGPGQDWANMSKELLDLYEQVEAAQKAMTEGMGSYSSARKESQRLLRWAEKLPERNPGEMDNKRALVAGYQGDIKRLDIDFQNLVQSLTSQITFLSERIRAAKLTEQQNAQAAYSTQLASPDWSTVNISRESVAASVTPLIERFTAANKIIEQTSDITNQLATSITPRAIVATNELGEAALKSRQAVKEQTLGAAQWYQAVTSQAGQAAEQQKKQMEQTAKALADIGGQFFENLLTKPREAMQSLWQDLKSFLLSSARELAQSKLFGMLKPGGSEGGASSGGGILSMISNLFGGGSRAGGGGGGGLLNLARSGVSGLKNLLGFGGSAAATAAAAAPTAAGAANAFAAPSALAALGGGGGAAAGGGGLASLGAFMLNPFTIAAVGAGVAGFFLWKKFRHGTEKRLREAIRSTYGVDIKDMQVLTQIKEIGEGVFGKGNVSKHLSEVIALGPVRELIEQYAESTGQDTSKIGSTRGLGDEGDPRNRYVVRSGAPRTPAVAPSPSSSIFSPMAAGAGSQSGTTDKLASLLSFFLAQVTQISAGSAEAVHALHDKLNVMRPGDVLAAGVRENPQPISDGLNANLDASYKADATRRRMQGII